MSRLAERGRTVSLQRSERTIDTTMRGVVYEGTEGGAAEVAQMAEYNEIPHAILHASREDEDAWVAAVLTAIDGVLAAPRAR
jgi:hypothetical protein